MFLRAIPVIALVTSLSACGGSSDGSAVNPVQPASRAQVLEVFANGDGVARTELTVDGTKIIGNVISPNVQLNVAAVNRDGLTITNVARTFIGTDGAGDFFQGQSIVNGELINVVEYIDRNGRSGIIYGENFQSSALIAGGPPVSSIPAGQYVYSGTNVVGYRDGSKTEIGAFVMGVDFTNGTGVINGSTNSSAISGNLSVNNQTGTFFSNNLAMTEVGVGQVSGTIAGNFHGASATGVSGVYHDNAPNPFVAGAIAGGR